MFGTGIGSSRWEGVRNEGKQLLLERSQIPDRALVGTALDAQGLLRGALIDPSSFLQAELETTGKLDERYTAWRRERLNWEPNLCEQEENSCSPAAGGWSLSFRVTVAGMGGGTRTSSSS